MTDMLTHTSEQDAFPTTNNRIRLAVREVRETAFRALYAAGVSSGEAAAAADTVTAMQLHARTGIDTLLETLDRLDSTSSPAGASLSRNSAVDIVDHSPRSGLLSGPLAVDLALSQSRPVLLSRIDDHEAVDWYALRAASRSGTTLWLVTLDDRGRHTSATVVTAAGDMHRDVAVTTALEPDVTIHDEDGGGTLVLTVPHATDASRPVHTAVERETRYRHAVSYGVFVDTAKWSRAYALGRRFLVPEANHD
ncbi:hypothetical protein OPAG_02984 [Rhodococcus opacus PD630]|uniref:hypothetical protein n=1 Tax=Rhodococcus opacus TaxID=37919 RepID=UPI00029CB128|nr:hypothetical protein [Rhodococcus opacus]AHK28291.1 hypothetical protein Pd630_LPD01057 [Rhodococcus opacus PD630]EHI44643.1 hypothetical protein OPAG_02984 [Rhodococcus opacus PD630]UDG98192.1 hypothetical protein K2Z90_001007 [Rhodococcus opacus PD630]